MDTALDDDDNENANITSTSNRVPFNKSQYSRAFTLNLWLFYGKFLVSFFSPVWSLNRNKSKKSAETELKMSM